MTADSRCGRPSGYQAHRHGGTPVCPPCLAAHNRASARWRTSTYIVGGPLTVDPTGTRRRLQALMRIGWTSAAIGAEFGVGGDTVRQWLTTRRVRRDTATKVAALYDRWWDKRGPSARTAGRAERAGWQVPAAWDDDEIDDPAARPCPGCKDVRPFDVIAVEQAVRGYPARLRPVERAEAVRQLTGLGMSAAQIAARLDVTTRTVLRYRQRGAA